MSQNANADQIAYWNGQNGQTWAESQEALDRRLQAMGDAAIAAAAPTTGESVIDIGCGTGATSLALAERVGPTGRVLGADVSQPMLDVARRRGEGVRNLSFVRADAAAHAFPPYAADLLFSRFGVMFFVEPEAAFKNLHKAVKPTGRIAFICWRGPAENPFFGIPLTVALNRVGGQAPAMDPHAPGPMAFADPVRVGHILAMSGFRTPAFAEFETRWTIADDPAAAAREALTFGMAARVLKNADQSVKDQFVAEMTDVYGRHVTAEGVSFPARCWVVTASA